MSSPADRLVEIRDFQRGLNLFASEANIAAGETTHAVDVIFDSDGTTRLRPPLQTAAKTAHTWAAPNAVTESVHAAPVTLGFLSAPNQSLTLPETAIFVAVVDTVYVNMFLIRAADVETHQFAHQSLGAVRRTPAPNGIRGVTLAGVAGNVYLCIDGVSSRVWFTDPDNDPLFGQAREVLTDPADLRGDYRVLPVANDGTERPDRQFTHTNQSWSTNYENPFADIQSDNTPYGKAGGSALADPGRIPPAAVVTDIDTGPTEHLFAAAGSILRWSHPVQWLDSGYYGYAPPLTSESINSASGDPGPDWPSDSPNHVGEGDAKLRLFGPEDWHRDDFTQIAPSDGEHISALAFFYDALLVFKQSTLWAVRGDLPDDLIVSPLTDQIGTPGPSCVAVTPAGVFFYSHPNGLYLYDGETVRFVSEPLGIIGDLFDGTPENLAKVSVVYHNTRILLIVPNTLHDTKRTFVYDLRHGGWSEWTAQIDAAVTLRIPGREHFLLAVTPAISSAGKGFATFRSDIDSGTASDIYGGTVDHFQAEIPYEAELRVGPVRDPNAPDMQCVWRRQRIEVVSDAAGRQLEAGFEHADPYLLPDTETYTLETQITGQQSLQSPLLRRRSRSTSMMLKWADHDMALTGALFTYWPGKRE